MNTFAVVAVISSFLISTMVSINGCSEDEQSKGPAVVTSKQAGSASKGSKDGSVKKKGVEPPVTVKKEPLPIEVDRQWQLKDTKEQIPGTLTAITDDSITIKTKDGEVRTIARSDLHLLQQRFLNHWSDPTKREALELFERIGNLNYEEDGSIGLGLSQSGCNDPQLRLVRSLPEVNGIGLFEANVTDDGLAALVDMPNIKFLDLTDTEMKGPGLRHVAKIKSLEHLVFAPYGGFRLDPIDEFLEDFKGHPTLKKLVIRFVPITSKALAIFGEIPNLETLDIGYCEIEKPQLGQLIALSKLRRLHLNELTIDDRQVGHLANHPELIELHLNSGDLTAKGTEHIGKLTKLEILSLNNDVTDDALIPLKQLTNLKTLHLHSDKVTDAGMAHLAGLIHVEDIVIPKKVTSAGFKHLTKMTKLKQIRFVGGKVALSSVMEVLVDQQGRSVREALGMALGLNHYNDKEITSLSFDERVRCDKSCLKYLAQLPKLKWLFLGKDTQDDWLEHLASLKNLEKIGFRGEDRHNNSPSLIKLTKEGLQHLSGLENLKALEFESVDLAEGALAPLTQLKKLESLRLSYSKFAPGNMEAIGMMTHLNDFSLTEPVGFEDADMVHVGKLVNVEGMNLPTTMTVKGFAHLKDLKKLRWVNWPADVKYADLYQTCTQEMGWSAERMFELFMDGHTDEDGNLTSLTWRSNMGTTEKDYEILATFKQLQQLSFQDEVSNAVVKIVLKLKGLRSLRLEGAEMTPGDFKAIGDMIELDHLCLSKTSVSDSDLEHISKLTNLSDLELGETSITDAGLKHLSKLKKLNYLRLYDTKLTKAGIKALQEAMPDARISN